MEIAIGVIQHAGQVLVGERGPELPLAGYWEFPGGKVQSGEDPAQAAVRECREETGLEVRIIGPLLHTTYTYDYATLSLNFFTGEPLDPGQIPRLPFRWMPIAALDARRFPAANAQVIAQLLATCAAKK